MEFDRWIYHKEELDNMQCTMEWELLVLADGLEVVMKMDARAANVQRMPRP